MKKIQKPRLLIPISFLVQIFLALFIIGLPKSGSPLWLMFVLVILAAFMITLSIAMIFSYLKQYIDYRMQELEANSNKK